MTSVTEDATIATNTPQRRFTLPAEHELRFEIPSDCHDATLTLQNGSAEIFGIELALKRPYPFPPSLNAAAFTWHGANLILSAPETVMAYTATDTPMPSYIAAHSILQSRRVLAKRAGIPGPRAVVVGPRDCGKTALVNILSAYCVKTNGCAIVGDLDPSGSGAAAVVPGAIALSFVTHLDLEMGGLLHEQVSSLMIGHTCPCENVLVSEKMFSTMGGVIDEALSVREKERYIGCVVDTSGEIDGKAGVECVLAAVKGVKADVIFVLGAERLYAWVQSCFEGSGMETVLLAKSGGVVSRDEGSRIAMRSQRIKEYFYGRDNRLSPFSRVVEFSQVVILKVGGVASVVPDSALPIGAESTLDPLKPRVVCSLKDVLHKVVAVSQAVCEEKVLTASVYGYLHVVKVDEERCTMTVLAPSPGHVPSKYLVVGDTKWIE